MTGQSQPVSVPCFRHGRPLWSHSMHTVSHFMCFGGLFLAAAANAQISTPTFPHPLITEILYAVPSGERGDANADGTRDAVGDEFIELTNPHDKPIQLK